MNMQHQKSLDVVEYKKTHSCMTLQQIGNVFGITRERARQILSKNGVPTVHYKPKYHCLQCGIVSFKKLFCSNECRKIWRHNKNYVTLICDCGCGEAFDRRNKDVTAALKNPAYKARFFKNKIHYGRWWGLHYGFGAHPERISGNIKNNLYNQSIKINT